MTNSEQIASPARSRSAKVLKQVRQLHLYLGVFFAPAIVFFSVTGAIQLFGLHEGHPGEAYQPPRWVAALSSIHKDQVLSRDHGPQPASEGQPGGRSHGPDQKRVPEEPHGKDDHHQAKATLVLKWFFLAMSIGLVASTFLGIYMAFKFNRSRALIWGLLIAGAAIPTALIALLA